MSSTSQGTLFGNKYGPESQHQVRIPTSVALRPAPQPLGAGTGQQPQSQSQTSPLPQSPSLHFLYGQGPRVQSQLPPQGHQSSNPSVAAQSPPQHYSNPEPSLNSQKLQQGLASALGQPTSAQPPGQGSTQAHQTPNTQSWPRRYRNAVNFDPPQGFAFGLTPLPPIPSHVPIQRASPTEQTLPKPNLDHSTQPPAEGLHPHRRSSSNGFQLGHFPPATTNLSPYIQGQEPSIPTTQHRFSGNVLDTSQPIAIQRRPSSLDQSPRSVEGAPYNPVINDALANVIGPLQLQVKELWSNSVTRMKGILEKMHADYTTSLNTERARIAQLVEFITKGNNEKLQLQSEVKRLKLQVASLQGTVVASSQALASSRRQVAELETQKNDIEASLSAAGDLRRSQVAISQTPVEAVYATVGKQLVEHVGARLQDANQRIAEERAKRERAEQQYMSLIQTATMITAQRSAIGPRTPQPPATPAFPQVGTLDRLSASSLVSSSTFGTTSDSSLSTLTTTPPPGALTIDTLAANDGPDHSRIAIDLTESPSLGNLVQPVLPNTPTPDSHSPPTPALGLSLKRARPNDGVRQDDERPNARPRFNQKAGRRRTVLEYWHAEDRAASARGTSNSPQWPPRSDRVLVTLSRSSTAPTPTHASTPSGGGSTTLPTPSPDLRLFPGAVPTPPTNGGGTPVIVPNPNPCEGQTPVQVSQVSIRPTQDCPSAVAPRASPKLTPVSNQVRTNDVPLPTPSLGTTEKTASNGQHGLVGADRNALTSTLLPKLVECNAPSTVNSSQTKILGPRTTPVLNPTPQIVSNPHGNTESHNTPPRTSLVPLHDQHTTPSTNQPPVAFPIINASPRYTTTPTFVTNNPPTTPTFSQDVVMSDTTSSELTRDGNGDLPIKHDSDEEEDAELFSDDQEEGEIAKSEEDIAPTLQLPQPSTSPPQPQQGQSQQQHQVHTKGGSTIALSDVASSSAPNPVGTTTSTPVESQHYRPSVYGKSNIAPSSFFRPLQSSAAMKPGQQWASAGGVSAVAGSPSNPAPKGTQPKGTPQLGMIHLPLLYSTLSSGKMSCRSCVTRRQELDNRLMQIAQFDKDASFSVLSEHYLKEHPVATEQLLRMSKGQIMEMRQRMTLR